jgi:hypothetical protein
MTEDTRLTIIGFLGLIAFAGIVLGGGMCLDKSTRETGCKIGIGSAILLIIAANFPA